MPRLPGETATAVFARRVIAGRAAGYQRLSATISLAHDEVAHPAGIETRFTLPRRETIKPPPRKRMWLISLVAPYLLVVRFQEWLTPGFRAWPRLADPPCSRLSCLR